ncbi:MAG: hypothetical protein ACFFCQ_17890, partial [Promethearchaeota archaeon]
ELEEKVQKMRLLSNIVDTQEQELQQIQNEQKTLLTELRTQQERTKNFEHITREYEHVSNKLAISLEIKEPTNLRDMVEILTNYLTSAGEKLVNAKKTEKALKKEMFSLKRMENAITQLAEHDPKILTICLLAKMEKSAISTLATETKQNPTILKMRLRRWADLGYVELSPDFLQVQISPTMVQ